jgi:PTS system glucitol/sorbitol-specific IIA component
MSYAELNVVEIGADASLMFEEKIMILFNNSVPDDLKEIAVVHDSAIQEEIEAGDEMVIDGEVFKILFVGDKVNETMNELGHATFNFSGESHSELPGTVCLEERPIPHISEGNKISFRKAN